MKLFSLKGGRNFTTHGHSKKTKECKGPQSSLTDPNCNPQPSIPSHLILDPLMIELRNIFSQFISKHPNFPLNTDFQLIDYIHHCHSQLLAYAKASDLDLDYLDEGDVDFMATPRKTLSVVKSFLLMFEIQELKESILGKSGGEGSEAERVFGITGEFMLFNDHLEANENGLKLGDFLNKRDDLIQKRGTEWGIPRF